MTDELEDVYKYVVVGGGIAGVTCVETLSALCPDERILLLTSSNLVKAVINYQKVSKTLESFDVQEKPMSYIQNDCPNVQVLQKTIISLDAKNHILRTDDGCKFKYQKLCICAGGKPKLISEDNAYVVGIRDTESVQEFQSRLQKARRIIVVGNGGIATELVYEVEGCEVLWAIKDISISSTFVDPGAAQFFLPHLNQEKSQDEKPLKRLKYTSDKEMSVEFQKSSLQTPGGALGPDWSTSLEMKGLQSLCHCVHVEYQVEVAKLWSPEELRNACKTETTHTDLPFTQHPGSWPIYVELTNGKIYGCDFVVSATGVTPNIEPFTENNKFHIASDGGLMVNDKLQTSEKDIYAAGDVCTASWDPAPHWFQMRLWAQARQMGAYAAKSMLADDSGDEIPLDFCFELFSHVTKFFNYKVILLGKYNAQGLGTDHELLLRVTKGKEYVKAVIQDGRLQGAVLIGDTDLEETFENLILNQLDLTPFKDHLLESAIDVEDFFD
ncbi:hypothetical protein ACJMK2_028927 [Sinanodonta woodiana]|uniref:Pyridine nucleotide-disulfide oxidoreductase domain-containing protein 1 n=1 Tax=Sinanodonta woodiana TaxID=1069815 RepID=A0ABD3X8M7_SINWO